MDEVSHMADLGVDFGKPVVNIDKLRGHKEKVIGKLTGGLAAMAKMRKVSTVRGYGAFVGSHHVEVEETTGTAQEKTGSKKVIAFKNCIISAGSQAVRLPFMPEDPRVADSTGALALKEVPKRMLILGGARAGTCDRPTLDWDADLSNRGLCQMLAGASNRGFGLCLQRRADSREKPLSCDRRQSPGPSRHALE